MPVKISKVQINETSFTKNTSNNWKKCVEYAKIINPNYIDLIPLKPNHTVSFEIENTSSAFANCIRRFIMEELDIISMDVDENNIKLKSKSVDTKAFGRHIEGLKGVSLTYDNNEEEKEYTVFGTKI